jgi:peptide/nickel transport system substrate-binding protein
VPYEYDLQRAKGLIAEAGWKDKDSDGIVEKDSKPLELSLFALSNRPGLPPMAEAIAGQLKEIGIKVNVEVLESGVITERQNSGNWDMNLGASSLSMVPDPSYMLGSYFKTGGSSNKFGYSNAKVDSLMTEANGMSDQKKRLSDFNMAQSIVHDELPVVPIAYYAMVVAMKDYVNGYEFDPTSHDYMLNQGIYRVIV